MLAKDGHPVVGQDALIEKWIEPDPHKSGAAELRLKEYAIHVWALVGHLQGVKGDVAKVAKAYDIPIEAVQAVAAYYESHREVIDDRIAASSA